jgi:hypothetical protein
MTAEHTILDTSFETDQLVDIVNHGMSSGVGGFIYCHEIKNTFDLYEDEIMTYLNDKCDDIYGKSFIQWTVNNGHDYDSLYDIKADAVWTYVEFKAYDLLMEIEHPSVY